jgi:hypothetical protein
VVNLETEVSKSKRIGVGIRKENVTNTAFSRRLKSLKVKRYENRPGFNSGDQ